METLPPNVLQGLQAEGAVHARGRSEASRRALPSSTLLRVVKDKTRQQRMFATRVGFVRAFVGRAKGSGAPVQLGGTLFHTGVRLVRVTDPGIEEVQAWQGLRTDPHVGSKIRSERTACV